MKCFCPDDLREKIDQVSHDVQRANQLMAQASTASKEMKAHNDLLVQQGRLKVLQELLIEAEKEETLAA